MTTIDHTLLPDVEGAWPSAGPAQQARWIGTALGVVALILLSVVLQATVVSPLRYARDQHVAYGSFRLELADGTAPVGQLTAADRLLEPGTAVATVEVPRLGIDEVVLEGTTSSILLSGPGHRRDTVLPGQAGASVVMGRQAVAGGPFGRLDELVPGDEVRTTTGQGEAVYEVVGVRRSGDPVPAPLASGAGRLTLVSASGTAYLPTDVLRVDARLVTPAQPTPVAAVQLAALGGQEAAFSADVSGWPTAVLALLGLGLAISVLVLLRRWWTVGPAWVVGAPLVLLAAVLASEQLLVMLPNLI
ncbi:sortase [Sanguibacter hominis ATCC BAA-789]|uniref:Sortase n=1 Tax=Sanguibacter hominis ATCC BAA-789 TaxID=1312740 RepID=A0A9X5INM2_9MICO|nr:sortase [Sanguibacter hominis ATCC BAA-789]